VQKQQTKQDKKGNEIFTAVFLVRIIKSRENFKKLQK
jgi:hypothetical protein